MSPSALSVNSQYGTPSSVRSGGWTLEQKSAMFPAHIEDDLVTTQYESPITDAVISKNQSDCEKWLESHDLTSPWQGAINSASKKLNRSRISSKSYSRGVDAWTQTITSLPPNFNLFDFLEKHGAPIQVRQIYNLLLITICFLITSSPTPNKVTGYKNKRNLIVIFFSR